MADEVGILRRGPSGSSAATSGDELRQLVDLEPAQDLSDARDAQIALHRERDPIL